MAKSEFGEDAEIYPGSRTLVKDYFPIYRDTRSGYAASRLAFASLKNPDL